MLRSTSHKRSKLQEKKAAADYEGNRSPGSGNGWIRKADVRSPEFLIECKTTSRKSYSLKLEDLSKIKFQALIDNRTPVLEIEFTDDSWSNTSYSFVVLDKEDFLDMRRKMKEGESD